MNIERDPCLTASLKEANFVAVLGSPRQPIWTRYRTAPSCVPAICNEERNFARASDKRDTDGCDAVENVDGNPPMG